jgi:hypothetical protein
MKASPNARSSMKMKTQIIIPPGGWSGLAKSESAPGGFTGRPLAPRTKDYYDWLVKEGLLAESG